MLPERTAVIVRTLMEYVRYEQNVFDNIERVLERVFEIAHEMPDEYRRAIEIALASDVPLATLGPEYHPEVIVRKFLAEIRERLVQLSPAREPITFN